MDDRQKRLREIVRAAGGMGPRARKAYLDEACGDDADLRRLVEMMLAEGATLGSTEFGGGARPMPAVLEPPERIGHYRIVESIARGGFGVVYLAEQTEPIRRMVALKMILVGMDTRTVIARFESERQALALMDHPNIAKVLDAGSTESGRPFFVMEYVPGVPITEHCDRYRLDLDDRLDLFMQVCEAVQHAHQKGIIHRDLKPSNILVTSRDADAQVKVIDFGVAKAVNHRLTERTLFTESGQLIGTPEYMSPEQAEMVPEDIDTRSDIYSLGVLLYELLTGSLPFEPASLRAEGLDAIHRVIREVDPPWPSTRISTLGDASSESAEHRRSDPRSLVRELRGDLDWITMKAMEKDRARRYATASEFAADLRRHLRNEAVIAGPPSAVYRIRKFVRRHRIGVAVGAAVAATILLGGITTTWQAMRAEALRQLERVRADEAQRLAYFVAIRSAAAALRQHDPATARFHLDRAPSLLKGWEWDHLHSRLDDSSAIFSTDPSDAAVVESRAVVTMAVDPLGRYVFSASMDGRLRWWDAASGAVIDEREAVEAPVTSAAFRDDGGMLATGGDQTVIRLWAPATRAQLGVLPVAEARVTALGFAPDGARLASGGADGVIRLWDPGAQTETAAWPVGDGLAVWAVRFSPDGTLLASVSSDGTVRLWDLATGTAETLVDPDAPGPSHGSALAVAFSPDGAVLAVGSRSQPLRLWSVADGVPVRTMGADSRNVFDLAFSGDGALLAAAGSDRALRVWSAADGAPRAVLRGHGSGLYRVAFSADGRRLFTSSMDGTIRTWDVRGIDRTDVLDAHGSGVTAVVFRRDQVGRLVTAGADGRLLTWDAASGRRRSAWASGGPPLGAVDSSPTDSTLAIGVDDGRVLLLPGAGAARELGRHDEEAPVNAVAFSPDGKLVASAAEDGTIGLWPLDGAASRMIRAHGSVVESVAFAPDGNHLASASLDGTVRVWDRAGNEVARPHDQDDTHMTSVAYSPDGRHLAAGGHDAVVRLWTVDEWDDVRELRGHTRAVAALAFCPGQERLVSGAYDTTLQIWDTGRGESLLTLYGHRAVVLAVAFREDGTQLVSGSADGTARIWDTVRAAERLPAAGGSAP